MGENKKKTEMPPSDMQAIEARLKLAVYEHLDDRVTNKFRSVMWQGAVLIAVCSAFIGVLGYSHISAFLSERLDKQVDEYFAAHGANRLKENLTQAESLIEQSQKVLTGLRQQEQELSEMQALKRLKSLEGDLASAKKMLDAITYGTVFVGKGEEFQLAEGPVVLTFKVRDIQMDKQNIVVLLSGGGYFDQAIKGTYVLDSDGHPVFGKEVNKLYCSGLFQTLDAVIQGGDKSRVMLDLRIHPDGISPEKDFVQNNPPSNK